MVDFGNVIAIGCDHSGFTVKQEIMRNFKKEGFGFRDYGCFSEESVDYPDIIHPLAKEIDKGIIKRGIIICGSGNGVAIVANKYKFVRAAVCWNGDITRLARQHNDANIMSVPARFLSTEEILNLLKIYLTTDFEGGRHLRRVEKISSLL